MSQTLTAIEKPTRVRFGVLAFLCVLAFVFYVDRLCISKAAASIEADLELSHEQMGMIFSAFTLAYLLFEVPTGAWGDRYGSRGVMTRIVLWWSAFTALTAAAVGLWSMIAIRFLFGAGEAGAFPNSARVLARWFPADRRGGAQGLINTMALVGGAAAPIAAAYLIAELGWRWAFVIFSTPGVIWAAAFYTWFRDDPAQHPGVNDGELALIGSAAHAPGGSAHPPIPWPMVLRSPNVWLLGGVISCSAFNTYLFFFWYPSYLERARGVSNETSGWLSGFVLAGGALGCLLGGLLIDRLIIYFGDRRNCRRGLGCFSLAVAATCLLLGINAENTVVSAVCMAGAMFGINATLANWWGAVADISGCHIGSMFGLMNSMGGVGAFVSPIFAGWFADTMGRLGYEGRTQWDPLFYVYAGVLLVGSFGWCFIDVRRPIQQPSPCVPETAPAEITAAR
jgi:MFS transporter, ACS family, glucarate transporter